MYPQNIHPIPTKASEFLFTITGCKKTALIFFDASKASMRPPGPPTRRFGPYFGPYYPYGMRPVAKRLKPLATPCKRAGINPAPTKNMGIGTGMKCTGSNEDHAEKQGHHRLGHGKIEPWQHAMTTHKNSQQQPFFHHATALPITWGKHDTPPQHTPTKRRGGVYPRPLRTLKQPITIKLNTHTTCNIHPQKT